jgi:hypothetical protein
MGDGIGLAPDDDGAEQGTLADEARLLRRTRWRLVAWSGLSTLAVLVVLAVALYAVTARALETASVAQLDARTQGIVAFLEGTPDTQEQPGLGFLFGNGNTLLYLFDDAGTPVLLGDRGPAVPAGLPEPDGVSAAAAAADRTDVRLSTLTIQAGGATTPGTATRTTSRRSRTAPPR